MSPVVDIVIPSRGDSQSRRQLLQDIERERQSIPDAITVTVEEGPSAAANRNAGAQRGSAPWIAFLDDDIRLPDGWLASTLEVCKSGSAADLFSGPIRSTHPRNLFSMASEDFVVRHKKYGDQWFLAGALIIIRRSVFVDLGGFDERFIGAGGEDWRLCVVAHAAQCSVAVVPDLYVFHDNPRNFRQLMARSRTYSISEAPSAPSKTSETGDSGEQQTHHPLPLRVARWPVTEYRGFRLQGRSRIRSLTSTALYVPWMASYLFHARQGHER